MASPPNILVPTRSSLLNRLKDWDDQEGWREFFNTYWKLIYATAIKGGLADAEAQDVVQDTVLSVAKKMRDFKYDPAIGSFKGWLLQLTRWRVLNQLKKRLPAGFPGARTRDDAGRTPTVERIPDPQSLRLDLFWESEWQKNLIDAAIERVKTRVKMKQYQVFHLHVVRRMPAQKVAEALSLNLPQVYLAKHRVVALIKKEVRLLEKGMF